MDNNAVKTTMSGVTRRFQSALIVLLDDGLDEAKDKDWINTIAKLRETGLDVKAFTNVDHCIDFISDMQEEKVFLISSGESGQTIVSVIHDISQINTIYIFSTGKTQHEQLTNDWWKVKGSFTDITSICQALKTRIQQYEQNLISISFIPMIEGTAEPNLNELDQSFMYTQILKEMLLTIDFGSRYINQFIQYCREQFVGNDAVLTTIDNFGREYQEYMPIWWYTRPIFLYPMLNRALRLMEVDLIINMGFFIRDLHENIALVHGEQYDRHSSSTPLIVYRGQGLSQRDFHQLKNTRGGLLSFNSFLSTSLDRDVSYCFADSISSDPAMIGVLFRININPSIHSTPYANITDLSYFQNENEILFTMHSIFRIGEIKPMDETNRLYEIELTLTTDNDPQLHALAERIRKETSPGLEGWYRLACLMIRLHQPALAQQILETMLKQTVDDVVKADIHCNFGTVKWMLQKYDESIVDFQNAIDIYQNHPSSSQELGTSYSSMGVAYGYMGEYSKALSAHQTALHIRVNTLSPYHADVAQSYTNIGGIYHDMGQYSTSLLWHKKAMEIFQITLPSNHPDLATCYNNTGLAHSQMGEYSKALPLYEKALKIRLKVLPPDHPDLVSSYFHIGQAYFKTGERSKGLQFCFKALEQLDKRDKPPS